MSWKRFSRTRNSYYSGWTRVEGKVKIDNNKLSRIVIVGVALVILTPDLDLEFDFEATVIDFVSCT